MLKRGIYTKQNYTNDMLKIKKLALVALGLNWLRRNIFMNSNSGMEENGNTFIFIDPEPFTQFEIEEMEQEIVEEYGLSSTADFQQLKFNSSNSTVQNVHISNNKLKQNTINKKQTNIKDLVNKESHNTLENSLSKDDLIDIADEFYSEFAVGRWTKKQWFTLIDKFITEIIDSDVEIVNPKNIFIHP